MFMVLLTLMIQILNLLLKEYKELFGEDGIIQVDHAGLECSVILGKYPWLDVVSLGPTMKSPHTTSERALIATVAPFWELLKKTLTDVPEKQYFGTDYTDEHGYISKKIKKP